MILGLSVAAFTTLHVFISLIGILSGLIVVFAMVGGRWLKGCNTLFLAATIATSVTGFFFHSKMIGPPHVVGVISLVVLAIALLALVLFWSNFIDPLLYLKSETDLTAPAMLHHLELLGPTNWPVFLAGAVVVTLPVIVAFVIAQRFLWSSERGTGWLGR